MIKYKDIEGLLWKWARYYCRLVYCDLEPEELINEVWLTGQVQRVKNPKFVQKRIRFCMLDVIRHKTHFRNKHKLSIVKPSVEDLPIKAKDKTYALVEARDLWDFLYNLPTTTPRERLILDMRLKKGMTLRQVGKAIGYSEGRIQQIYKALIERFKAIAGRSLAG